MQRLLKVVVDNAQSDVITLASILHTLRCMIIVRLEESTKRSSPLYETSLSVSPLACPCSPHQPALTPLICAPPGKDPHVFLGSSVWELAVLQSDSR